MKKHKILSLAISVIMIIGLIAGCGSHMKDGFVEKSPLITGKVDKSPITLTMFTCDSAEDISFDDDVAKKITEITGVTLRITHSVPGDSQAIPLMIASGEYPDLIYAKSETDKLIDSGAIIKLDDYIEKEGGNLKALYGNQIKRLRYSSDDKSIYTVGTYGVNTEVWDPDGTLQIQNAVLKELGYPKIKTVYDYEDAIKKYIDKYPEIDGKKTIGMSLMASDWRWLTTCGNIASAAAGIPDDGQFKIDDETQKATYKFQLPEVKEYFKWLNHINAEGLLDPESFTQNDDIYKEKLSQGIVLGISDVKWDYDQATKALISSGRSDRTYARLPITLGEQYKCQSLKSYGFSGAYGLSIASTCENKERAFQFLDWLASDEAQILLNWGIEGKHYTYDENGKRKFTPDVQKQMNTDKDFVKKTGIGKYLYPFPQKGNGAVESTGNTYAAYSAQLFINNYNDAEKQTLEGYGVKSWPELYPSKEELGESKHGQVSQYNVQSRSDIGIIQKKIDDYTQRAITQAILGSPEDFDAAWNKIQKDLKDMNIDKLNEGMSELAAEKIKLWND